MRTINFANIWIITFLGLLLHSSDLIAQPVRDRILGDLVVSKHDGGGEIQVGFTFPVRYVKHFPYESGDELRVQVEPIAISRSDKDALFKRESIKPPRNGIPDLLEVIYEGDVVEGPFVTLVFRRPVAFKVEQGADFRSLTITVRVPERSAPPPPAK
jgi:hypothetical protein